MAVPHGIGEQFLDNQGEPQSVIAGDPAAPTEAFDESRGFR
jgi:hypothetical protein